MNPLEWWNNKEPEQISKKLIHKETSEKISNNPDNLFSKQSLQKIKVSVENAKESAYEVLGIDTKKIVFNDLKSKIEKYQEDHGLWKDWKIGAEMYREMEAWKTLKKAIEQKSLSIEILNEIKKHTSSMKLGSVNYIKLMVVVNKENENKSNDKKRQKIIDEILWESRQRLNSPEWKNLKQEQLANNKEANKSFYGIIKDDKMSWDEKVVKIVTDPTLLMITWTLFLFGVIGGDKTYTDSFLKRIGWIIWIATFWKAAWNKMWVWELLGDTKDLAVDAAKSEEVKDFKENVSKGFEKWKEKTWTFFKTTFPETFNKISTELWIASDNVFSKINSYNNSIRDDKDKKGDYIEEEKLDILSEDLLWDKRFLNTSKDDLNKINSINTLSPYITEDTKNILNKEKINDRDIKSFIQKHLLLNSFQQEDKMVSDIFLTAKMKEEFTKMKIDNVSEIIKWNTVLDNNVKSILSIYVNSIDPILVRFWEQLTLATKDWKIKDFKLEDFPSIKDTDKKSIKKSIENIKYILDWEEHIEDQISNINKIILSTWDIKDNEKTLEGKLKLLDNIKLDDNKIKTFPFSKEKFDFAKKDKEYKIYKEASDLWITQLWTTIVVSNLQKLNWEKDVADDKAKILELSIETPPDKNKTAIEFKKYYDVNSDKIKQLKDIKSRYDKNTTTDYNKMILDINTELSKNELFKKNFEEKKTEYKTKIEGINNSIKRVIIGSSFVPDIQTYNTYRNLIEEWRKNLDIITKDCVEWFTVEDWINTINKYIKWTYISPTSKNSFEYLNGKMYGNEKRDIEWIELIIIKDSIEDTITNLEKLEPNFKPRLQQVMTSTPQLKQQLANMWIIAFMNKNINDPDVKTANDKLDKAILLDIKNAFEVLKSLYKEQTTEEMRDKYKDVNLILEKIDEYVNK